MLPPMGPGNGNGISLARADLFRFFRQLAALACVLLSVNAPAADADPRVTADAARCLEIDADLAELAGQARTGAVTPEIYKQRSEALNAERKRITDAYGARNSPPARGLTAEYNRLKATVAAEARERAAAELKARREAAAAEAKAKRDAAAAEAAAKAQARKEADAAAAAEKTRLAEATENAIFADVSAVADERLQRTRDKFYRDFGLPDPTAAARAAEQTAAALAVRARHVPPQSAELRPPFDQRVEALYQKRLPEQRGGWFVEVFPDAAEITARVSGDAEQTAALELATRRLSENTTGVRPHVAQARLESYQAARQALKYDFTRVKQLTEDKEFEARVFAKNLPAYAADLQRHAKREKEAAEFEAKRKRTNQLINLLTLVVVAVGLWFPVRLMRRQQFKWKRQSQADWEKQMAASPLPKELWWVEVPCYRYPVSLASGRIYDKEVWTETTVTTTTTTTPGTNYSAPTTSTSTSYSSTTYHRYWMVTTEGKQTWQKYSDNEVIASIGQKLSSLWTDNHWVLMAFNHETGAVSARKWWTSQVHAPPYWRTVGLTTLLCLAIAIPGTAAIVMTAGFPINDLSHHTDFSTKVITGVFPVLFICLLMYVGFASGVMTFLRQRHFQKKVVPLYAAFLRDYNPVIPDAPAIEKA